MCYNKVSKEKEILIMKISTTITQIEVEATKTMLNFDPCTHIQCGELECANCPLHECAEELRKAQTRFEQILDEIDIEG